MTLIAPVPLDDGHLLDEFTSGTASLDDWLRRRARANHESGASRTFVLCDDARVIAYYSLASSSIACAEAVGRFRRNMPDPIPVITLARLAIDQSIHGKGFGRALIRDAGRRVIAAADLVGVRGMIVHAISDDAKQFYLACGFLQSPTNEMTLMIPLSDLKAAA
ncbi:MULTISPECIES: GNAT family N-acetyltransferase [Sphingobium]|uniref:GNAT family N-acetyltransferase n=1 Tax=Sphingobium TaxID=165695 RepID=UPI00076FF41E|nr:MULTISPECIES: GNAT family N-acetyltransferase [unclassified Sphingobium]AMK25810.1 GCN5-like N-acetyltransferase [Sphingobium sp. TKS]MEC6698582.1 GNAT family N-acetyltransferase [Sphingobium sp. SJ10-10]NML87721.1 GNAT family N-acetyltransferase [Sphingobium sp. TB-6]PNQ04333.1 GNAT family acetyltransferase [Sphingobium sp. SA916]